jgi:two-component system, NtrC family, sensor histidine kinase PilS
LSRNPPGETSAPGVITLAAMGESSLSTAKTPTDLAWRVVGLLNLYRLLVPPVLLAIRRFGGPQTLAGSEHTQLFVGGCVLYFALGVGLVLARRRLWPSLRVLTLVHAGIDSIAIALVLYASGGVASGLGILYVVPVGATALLATERDALLIAATAALTLLIQQMAGQLLGSVPASDYTTTGVLGAVLFLVSLLAWPIANRLRESEALVRRQEIDLANLAQLSQYVVQHLRESILVVDASDRIRLINESAAQLLGDSAAYPGALIGEASPRLLYLLASWRQRADGDGDATLPDTFVAADGARVIRPHFAPLGSNEPAPVIVFLEDTGEIAAKVQQTKLAELGRLSASIAHEIRNPVGAMSHAAQLLSESGGLSPEDLLLTQIIRSNSERVSEIVGNVQRMARRDAARLERLELEAWLIDFRTEFCNTMQFPQERLTIAGQPHGVVEVRADPSQLTQVVWNLCENAIKYGRRATDRAPLASIELRFGRLPNTARPYLEVADRGPGIPLELSERIFEPFFTGTAPAPAGAVGGTGLGLFLARELAQANGAALLYEAREGGGSLFRVVFSDPLRWEF